MNSKNLYIRACLLLVCVIGAVGLFFQFDKSHENKPAVSKKSNTSENIYKNATLVKDLRFPEYAGPYLKIHLLNSEGEYLQCSSLDIWPFLNGQRGKDGLSCSFDINESILIRPLAAHGEGSRRSLESNQEYGFIAFSKYFSVGFSKEVKLNTPEIIDGKIEYEVFIKFEGVKNPLEDFVTIKGILPKKVKENSYTVGYWCEGANFIKVIPAGNKYEIKVPKLGGELMVGGGEKSSAIVHVMSVNNFTLDNATDFVDQSNLVERELSFSKFEKNTIIEFLPSDNAHLPLSWVKVKSGESHAKVFLSPRDYFYRFSTLDATRDSGKKPNGKITVDNKTLYELQHD